jgi:hypothetical protein
LLLLPLLLCLSHAEVQGLNMVPAGGRLLVLNPMGVDDDGREVPLEAVKKNVLGFTQVGFLRHARTQGPILSN